MEITSLQALTLHQSMCLKVLFIDFLSLNIIDMYAFSYGTYPINTLLIKLLPIYCLRKYKEIIPPFHLLIFVVSAHIYVSQLIILLNSLYNYIQQLLHIHIIRVCVKKKP